MTTQDELRDVIGDMASLADNILAYTNIGAKIPMAETLRDLKTGQAALNDIYCEMFRAVEGAERGYTYRCVECLRDERSETEPPPGAICIDCAAEHHEQEMREMEASNGR